MLEGSIRFGLLPVAADVQWDKLEKQVYYCSFNEHLLMRVDSGLCFLFIGFFFFSFPVLR